MESLRSLRLRWQDLLGEGVCECSTSLETGVESVETLEPEEEVLEVQHVPTKLSLEPSPLEGMTFTEVTPQLEAPAFSSPAAAAVVERLCA